MSRTLMPKKFEPCLTLMEPTPDGCAELVLEVNGNYISSTVLTPIFSERGWLYDIESWWKGELNRRC